MEKGGKGFSLPTKTARKSSLKSTTAKQASLKGKDDSSAKSKRAMKVQFDVEGSLSGRFETPPPKGDSSKWGKGDKTAKGGKGSVSKPPPPLELKIEQELPENVKCMMDCEAADILQGIQDQMTILSKDPEFKLPPSFDRGLLYAKRVDHYTNPLSVRQVLQTLKKYGVSDGEMCVIANACPELVDEVFALVPSLKNKRSKLSEPLKDVLGELAKLKKSTSLESQMKSAEAGNPGNVGGLGVVD
ncbi:DNA-directed RNA polymerases IV and V subunit 4-like isoform X1 [Juglans microcarpa x Juglans regia]|uniref:DNA-directed RNA polymerases IV and V subunit 4-like isoform X1 n=1 Tax=Juglans microcarpa x Juglans regia TaxID=2249226 RepID=UPI001B7F21C6|nr:DNA-directed RNA polymerases IV and V subunit 4-like isoform X1 [Juglans microcarpa x Juglans regia]XP_041028847.1 DNA-directed RNA polymerases IV and V subunit 4-like isoform X1 [Juglans microcarpa x Juglans regia]